jgi:hypothetical protein
LEGVPITQFKNIRHDDEHFRAEHMKQLIEDYEQKIRCTQDAATLAQLTKKIQLVARKTQQAEVLREPFRIINNSVKAKYGGGISKIWIPAKLPKVAARFCEIDGSLTAEGLQKMAQSDKHSVYYATEMDSAAIDKALLQYGKGWFREAAKTDFGAGELYDMVGFDGLTQEADAILNGNWTDHMGMPMSPELTEFLKQCKRPDNIKPVDVTISKASFIHGFRSWSERTSTSPSGRSLNHYKAIIADNDLCAFFVTMINLPLN